MMTRDVGRAGSLAAAQHIAVFRALQLGDNLCAVPALRALRHARPQAHIAWIGLPWMRDFLPRLSHYVDEFIEFPGFPGLVEQAVDVQATLAFLKSMQERKFDLVLQMHGSGGISNPLVTLFGARRTAGYCEPGAFCPDPETYLPYPHHLHEVERHLLLMRSLGMEASDTALELPLTASDFAELAEIAGANRFRTRPYICVHPGGRYPSRRWPAERFAAVADRLAAEGFEIVLTGSAAERELTATVQAAMRTSAHDLAGKTTLGSVGALVQGAQLVLTNDTGMSHIAAAMRTPSVVIVLSSDCERWAPLDHERHRTLTATVPCRPCEHRVCPIGFPCATLIDPDEVFETAMQALGRHGSPPLSLPLEKEASCADCVS